MYDDFYSDDDSDLDDFILSSTQEISTYCEPVAVTNQPADFQRQPCIPSGVSNSWSSHAGGYTTQHRPPGRGYDVPSSQPYLQQQASWNNTTQTRQFGRGLTISSPHDHTVRQSSGTGPIWEHGIGQSGNKQSRGRGRGLTYTNQRSYGRGQNKYDKNRTDEHAKPKHVKDRSTEDMAVGRPNHPPSFGDQWKGTAVDQWKGTAGDQWKGTAGDRWKGTSGDQWKCTAGDQWKGTAGDQWKGAARGRGCWKLAPDAVKTSGNELTFEGNFNRPDDTGWETNLMETASAKDVKTDTGVSVWMASKPACTAGNVAISNADGNANNYFDSNVDWAEESSSEQYVVKPKTYNTPIEFKPGSKLVGTETQTDAHEEDITDKWIAKTLALRPAEPPIQELEKVLLNAENMWHDDSRKDKSFLSQYLSHQYSHSVNPYALVVFLLDKASDSHVAKTTTLAFLIIKEFDKFCKKYRSRFPTEKFVTQEMQLNIFHICTRRHMTMFDMAVRCYELCYDGNKVFLPTVKKFVDNKKYKEAAVCAGKLGLQQHFDMTEIVLPLILQDKVNLIEAYVCGYPEHQQKLVQYLDHLCDRTTDLDLVISSVPHVSGIKRDKFQAKILKKLAIRLTKLYKIPQDLCPNIANARGVGALRYLLHKRYIEKGMGSGSWEEMVQGAVGDNDYMKEQLVEQLALYNEYTEAAKWAIQYNLEESVIPAVVITAMEELKSKTDSSGISLTPPTSNTTGVAPGNSSQGDEEDWESSCFTEEEMNSAYHQLPLPLEMITIVDTLDGYKRCMKHITQAGAVVGIDSEWRPAFCGQVQKVALLQLAVRDSIYLLDMLALEKLLSDNMWQQFVEEFFCSVHILKLGYGIESDLKMILRTFPSMKEPMMNVKRVVNLEVLAKKLVLTDINPALFDDDEDSDVVPRKPMEVDDPAGVVPGFKSEEKGLSELVRRCLGRPLNKSEQMSNWERRPLRNEQLRYAALDAYVLLELYDILTKLAKTQDPSMDLEPLISMKWLKPSKNEKKRARQRGDHKQKSPKKLPVRQPQMPVPREPQAPRELRVVVDTMLHGLGKQLRSCGVDVAILEPYADHYRAIEISRKENRIILTSGMPYDMIVGSVGCSMCYNVQSDTAREQVVEVLTYFNIAVKKEDIFSRCQVCNSNVYLHIPAGDMSLLAKRKYELISGQPQSGSANSKGDNCQKSDSFQCENNKTMGDNSDTSVPKYCKLDERGDKKTDKCFDDFVVISPTHDDNVTEGASGSTSSDRSSDNVPSCKKALCPSDDSAKRFQEYGVDWCTVTVLASSAAIQTETVPQSMFTKVDWFYCCAQCGKVFWEGTHFERVCEQFAHVLKMDGDCGATVYDKLTGQ